MPYRIQPDRVVAYSYVRSSSRDQVDRGEIEGQISKLVLKARQRQWFADRYYADRAVGIYYAGKDPSMIKEQEALHELFSDVANDPHQNKVIFATDVSRFCRSRAKSVELWKTAMSLQTPFATLKGIIEFTPDGERFWLEECARAEDGYRTQQEDFGAGTQAYVAAGGTFGPTPWGLLRREDGTYGIDPETRSLLRNIFDRFLQREPLPQIHEDLHREPLWIGLRTLQSNTYIARLRKMRSNPAYAGARRGMEIVARGDNAESIITTEEFCRIQLLHPPRSIDTTDFYALGKLRCSYCETKLKASELRPFADKQGEIDPGWKAYICPDRRCAFSTVNYLAEVHANLDRYVIIKAKVDGDPKLVERWTLTPREARAAVFREIFRYWNPEVYGGKIDVPAWAEW
jgi:hypothetical protein